MSHANERCAPLEKIFSPAGDRITLRAYQEYVCRLLREELTMDEIRDLMIHLHCGVDELVDKIVETKMAADSPRGLGFSRGLPA